MPFPLRFDLGRWPMGLSGFSSAECSQTYVLYSHRIATPIESVQNHGDRSILMRKSKDESITSFLIETPLYAVLVVGYFFLILHFLGGRLKDLFDHHKVYYAFVALALIVVQGVVLESLTTVLLKLIRSRTK
jgi:hypothetical protein